MKLSTIHLMPAKAVEESVISRMPILIIHASDDAETKDYKADQIKKRAGMVASIGQPLDDVHGIYLEMLRSVENVNIEVEVIGRTEDEEHFSYGVEFIFVAGEYIKTKKVDGVQQYLRHEKTYQELDITAIPDGEGLSDYARVTLEEVVKSILDLNKITYAETK